MESLNKYFLLVLYVAPLIYFILSFLVLADKKPEDEIEGIKDNYSYALWPFSNLELFYEHGKSMCKVGRVLFILCFVSFAGYYFTK